MASPSRRGWWLARSPGPPRSRGEGRVDWPSAAPSGRRSRRRQGTVRPIQHCRSLAESCCRTSTTSAPPFRRNTAAATQVRTHPRRRTPATLRRPASSHRPRQRPWLPPSRTAHRRRCSVTYPGGLSPCASASTPQARTRRRRRVGPLLRPNRPGVGDRVQCRRGTGMHRVPTKELLPDGRRPRRRPEPGHHNVLDGRTGDPMTVPRGCGADPFARSRHAL